jgi:hypothetical protein
VAAALAPGVQRDWSPRSAPVILPGLTYSRLQQTSAQASSTKANHRPAARSQRTCNRRKQLSPDSVRSTFHRCRPSRAADSTPRRAIRGLIPPRRR